MYGQNDDDTLEGENGNDLLFGAAGNDTIDGGPGIDNLQGAAGDDALDGGPDSDLLFGQAGEDDLDGGSGTNTCFQGAGVGTLANCGAPTPDLDGIWEMLDGTRLEISDAGRAISGVTFCKRYEGSLLTGGPTFIARDITTTDVPCLGLNGAESPYIVALRATYVAELFDNGEVLVLTGRDSQLVLGRLGSDGLKNLNPTEYANQGGDASAAPTPLPPQSTLDLDGIWEMLDGTTLEISDAGRAISGVTFCKRFEGSLVTSGKTFVVRDLATTDVPCLGLNGAESPFIVALYAATAASLTEGGEVLVLTGPGVELVFDAVP